MLLVVRTRSSLQPASAARLAYFSNATHDQNAANVVKHSQMDRR